MRYLFLLFFFSGYSQTFTYTGNVSESGLPLPGATICIKNTSNCTSSDFDGNYSIDVKMGDELVISYVGMKDTYLKVDTKNLKLAKGEVVMPIFNNAFLSKIIMDNDTLKVSTSTGTNRGINQSSYFHNSVVAIKKDRANEYSFVTSQQYHKLYIELYNEFIVGQPIRQNRFQNQFAQGRSLDGMATYQSPETNEIFSWGPLVNTLQLSDNSTPYYPNGDIVELSGNGNPLTIYNPNRFFRNSIDYKTSFSAKLVMPNDDYLKFNLIYRNSSNSIETSKNDEITASLSFFKMIKGHKLNTSLNYNHFDNNLSNSNFIYNKVIFANAVTPIHFDNKIATLLPNGLPRNFSAFENNPYYLLNYNQDMNSSNLVAFTFTDEYLKNDIANNITVVSQFSDIENTFGNIPNSAEIDSPSFSSRNEKYTLFSITNDFKYNFNYENSIGAKLNFKHQNRNLKRFFREGFTDLISFPNFPSSEFQIERSQERTELNLNLNGDFKVEDIFDYDRLLFKLSSDLLYSSTLKNKIITNFNVGFDWRDFVFRRISLLSNWSYRQYEPDLQNNNLSFNSLSYRLDQFKQIRNTNELFSPDKTLNTTNESNFTVGLRYQSPVIFDLELYQKNVSNLYTPFLLDGFFTWIPAVDYYQKGLELTMSYDFNKYNYYQNFSYSTSLNFSTYKNKVTAISQNTNRISIAGFSDINKNYMLNQPLGVIVGNAFERDSNNNLVIDEQGFPIVSDEPRILGDPNPDFMIGLTNTFKYKKIKLDIAFDWSQGGELWNGTRQTLNYYGVSKETENLRNTTGYLFNGVTQSGSPNTQTVSFYDTNLSIEQNRWVRYGVGGVAEDAIEDASFFRLNNISLSYTNDVSYYSDKLNFTISFFVNNVFILSKNKTSFSGNSLFNSAETSGLDYFNSPMLRTYGFSVAIKI